MLPGILCLNASLRHQGAASCSIWWVLNACSWERFCNTFRTFIHHVATEKYPLCVHSFFYCSVHRGILTTGLNCCHQKIPYVGKAKCQTDGFLSGCNLPHCKSSFSEMWNKIDFLYKSPCFPMVIENCGATDKRSSVPFKFHGDIFFTCSPLLFPQQPPPEVILL